MAKWSGPPKSSYPLSEVKAAARAGRVEVDERVLTNLNMDLGLTHTDILMALRQLSGNGALRTNPCRQRPGFMEDHYRLRFKGLDLYTHFHLERLADGNWVIVASFKAL